MSRVIDGYGGKEHTEKCYQWRDMPVDFADDSRFVFGGEVEHAVAIGRFFDLFAVGRLLDVGHGGSSEPAFILHAAKIAVGQDK
jgi:hypothetical protein